MKDVDKIGNKLLFKLIYEHKFNYIASDRYEENSNFFISLFSDENKLKYVMNMMADVIYQDLNGR